MLLRWLVYHTNVIVRIEFAHPYMFPAAFQ